MDCNQWLPDYMLTTYGHEIIFDQPDLDSQVNILNFVTRMIIPKLNAYVLILSTNTKEDIKDKIKTIFIAVSRRSEQCPICFNDARELDTLICKSCLNIICIDCCMQICLHNEGKLICPFCRAIKGEKRSDYDNITKGSLPFYVKK